MLAGTRLLDMLMETNGKDLCRMASTSDMALTLFQMGPGTKG